MKPADRCSHPTREDRVSKRYDYVDSWTGQLITFRAVAELFFEIRSLRIMSHQSHNNSGSNRPTLIVESIQTTTDSSSEQSQTLAPKPLAFLLDVDGVMTDGKFYYTAQGKSFKAFGPDDHDALSLLKPHLHVSFVTGDKRGFEISRARIVEDMQMELNLVSTIKRIDWIRERWDPKQVIYMGDGIFDHYVFREVGYGIAPANADQNARQYAQYITERSGGDRAVAEAALHILERFFQPYDPNCLPNNKTKLSGQWAV